MGVCGDGPSSARVTRLDAADGQAPLADGGIYWSSELEGLHEESSRSHFLDVWTRQAITDAVSSLGRGARVVDLGCSTGYLLEDLQREIRGSHLLGLDFIFSGLRAARTGLHGIALLQGDVCALPFSDEAFDGVVSANLLEHVPDDLAALGEIRRVLKPGSPAALVVPAGPNCYDYYDRYLRHQRRYGRGELAAKARSQGLEVLRVFRIGWTIYPAFWLVKKRNRWLHDDLTAEDLANRVAKDIAATKDSRVGHLACRLERALTGRGLSAAFGIREVAIIRRPET